MKNHTAEWVAKAEGDWLTAGREKAALPPNRDATVFHAQQCAEKYLKAVLVENEISFPKTHDLEILLDLLAVVNPHWEKLRESAAWLSSLGIEVRYPGRLADDLDAEGSIVRAGEFRLFSRIQLNLPRD
jgi:HEPN domain-containing protein